MTFWLRGALILQRKMVDEALSPTSVKTKAGTGKRSSSQAGLAEAVEAARAESRHRVSQTAQHRPETQLPELNFGSRDDYLEGLALAEHKAELEQHQDQQESAPGSLKDSQADPEPNYQVVPDAAEGLLDHSNLPPLSPSRPVVTPAVSAAPHSLPCLSGMIGNGTWAMKSSCRRP
mmetsp:Transcript_37058/g.104623  ORF Transcript_37058/g.104623 Transcript_37058/m.104623 type:complete len:176 (-) Transcript_37058:1182-1709(-)